MCWDCLLRHSKDVDRELRRRGRAPVAGCIVCLDCPRDHHDPPYLAFWMSTHVRQHLRAHRQHRIVYWCIGDGRLEARIEPHWNDDIFPDLSVRLIDVAPPTEVGGVPHGSIMSSPCSKPQEAPMCTFRHVKVTWPDGRKAVLLIREDPEEPGYCGPCGMSEATFRSREMAPHDTLGHLEIYHQVKVVRGRRLSERQAARALEVEPGTFQREEFKAYAMPGILVDVGQAS